MSDLLLVGDAPGERIGEEYFLHCMDWWYQIVWAIEALVDESFPFNELFFEDMFLAPITPHLNGAQACRMAALLKENRESGKLSQELVRILRESFDEGDESQQMILKGDMDERMTQIDEFIFFLDSCNGCRAKWYAPEE